MDLGLKKIKLDKLGVSIKNGKQIDLGLLEYNFLSFFLAFKHEKGQPVFPTSRFKLSDHIY